MVIQFVNQPTIEESDQSERNDIAEKKGCRSEPIENVRGHHIGTFVDSNPSYVNRAFNWIDSFVLLQQNFC